MQCGVAGGGAAGRFGAMQHSISQLQKAHGSHAEIALVN